MAPAIQTSPVALVSGAWIPGSDSGSEPWTTWAEEQRKVLIGELLGHGSWFSKPPRREVLESLFAPWFKMTLAGQSEFTVDIPAVPANANNGLGVWNLDGLIMTATSIRPLFSVASYKETADVDAIPFFDGATVDSAEEREINLEDIESEAAPPTQIRNREWETRKFLAKERVRESRLKAQIANRMAQAEEARYLRHFGDLEDGESHFSDYDLSTDGSETEDSESPTLT